MAYCLYLRKSRADLEAESRGEGETLARHEKALLELAEKQDRNILRIYREIVSGETIAERPVMQHLLSEVERGAWDGVFVMEVERLARGDTIDQGIVAQTFKLSKTKIITPVKTYDPDNEFDEEYFEFGLFMSRREYKTINRRLQRGRVASVKEGKYLGSKPPYGYFRVKLEHDKGFTLEPDLEQAPIVRMIFHLYAYGERRADGTIKEVGVTKIVRKLNDCKVPTTNGSGWGNATVQGILRNPVYIGKIRWRFRPQKKVIIGGRPVKQRPRAKEEDWVLADGLHKPLIDEKTWRVAQQRLSRSPSRPGPESRPIKNSLAGLAVCGLCGRTMVRRPYSSRYPDTLMCAAPLCRNISSRLSHVEEPILIALRQWLAPYRLTYDRPAPADIESDMQSKILKQARNELSELEKQRDQIHDLFEKGTYTVEIFQERLQKISLKIQDTRNRIAKLAELADAAKQGQVAIVPDEGHILDWYEKAMSPAEKNDLLRSVLDKAVYTKAVNGRWHNHPDDFELILYPKLPLKSE